MYEEARTVKDGNFNNRLAQVTYNNVKYQILFLNGKEDGRDFNAEKIRLNEAEILLGDIEINMKHFLIFPGETFATKPPKGDESGLKTMLADAGKAYHNWGTIE